MAPPLTPSSATAGYFQPLPLVQPAYSSPSNSAQSGTGSSPVDVGDDPTIQRLVSLYLPSPTPAHITRQLHDLSRLVLSPSILAHGSAAEEHPPTLHPLTTFGEPNLTPSQLKTSPSWTHLCDVQTTLGTVGHSFPQQPPTSSSTSHSPTSHNPRIHAFLLAHLWDPSTASVSCPAAMTDGAAVLLREQLLLSSPASNPSTNTTSSDPSNLLTSPAKKRVFEETYRRLTSLDPAHAWRAGQWMTERSGGSDVRGTETVARRVSAVNATAGGQDAVGLPLGDWEVSGFKWFSSATDADCAVLLAKTPGSADGEGEARVSCFVAPVHRREEREGEREGEDQRGARVVMNGVRISRLKDKMGTKALPTAELELSGMRAWLVGREGEGTKVISAVLNITRLHTAKGGMAALGRGLAVARAWARARLIKDPTRGKGGEKVLLMENLQHVRWMAEETVKYRAYTAFYMFGVALLGVSEVGEVAAKNTKARQLGLLPDGKTEALALLRLLTPAMKQACSLAAVQGIRECMESLGGVGYCENVEDGGVLNLARLLRNANVNPIWEGTTSVLAEDLLRALRVGSGKGVETLETVVGRWLRNVLAARRLQELFGIGLGSVWNRYSELKQLLATKSEEELLWKGRVVVRLLSQIFCSVLLMVDALVDEDEVAIAVAKRWVGIVGGKETEDVDWRTQAAMDRRIFLGDREAWTGAQGKPQAKL